MDCSSITNLWICLICGNIGCGRYGRAHAQAHYERTTHLYALELETQRVWDYAGDGYVHRLIQNKADGKLVELPSASMGVREGDSSGGLGPGLADTLSAEKIEAIGIEYSYLLTSQLDSQREYYEEQRAESMGQVEELKLMVQSLGKEVEKERSSAAQEREQRRKEEGVKIDEMHRDKIKAEKRAEKIADVAKKLEKELREERAVSEGLMRNLEKMKEKVEEADKEKAEFRFKIADLEDQVRDVMFFLEAKTKIEHGGGAEAEAAGGSIEMPTSPPATGKKKKYRKG
jgi:BRCA1-associated protein